jgi:ATP-dependent Clp protease, protease subunit
MEVLLPQDRIIEEMKLNSAIRDRRIFVNEVIDSDVSFKTVYFLDRIVSLDNKSNIPISERESIEILIDSPGGHISSGLSIISKVEELKDIGYKIITTDQASASSMAFMLLIVGSERRAYRYSNALAHQPSQWIGGTLQELEDEISELKRLWNLMKMLILKYTKIPESRLDEVKEKKQDWILTPSQALEMGCVDYIM